MIKVSHEVPLSLLEQSREFNDYDYALVHLFEQFPQYYDFYKQSVEQGRDVLLDNSIFELEEAFDEDSFAKWVERLRPTRYIIPDVLDNSKKTIENLYSWNTKYGSLPGRKIGVVQGEDYEALTNCYLEVAKNCDEIAISFNYKFYEEMLPDSRYLDAWCIGRKLLICQWIEEGIIDKSKRHHLLGCSLPQEFKFYANFDWIYSLDTSNPIVHGLLGIEYQNGQLKDKESIKLADLIESEVTVDQMKLILQNVKQFKNNLQ